MVPTLLQAEGTHSPPYPTSLRDGNSVVSLAQENVNILFMFA